MQIPTPYRAILAAVCGVFPGAMIAGGAMRDLDNDKPVKDIDVFAPNVPDLDTLKARAASISHGCIVGVMGGYETWATRECVGVLDLALDFGEVPDTVDFQIIGLRTGPESILPRLDFGICRIGFDGEEVIRTPEYLKDQAARTFTLKRCDDAAQRDRSIRRFDRLAAKYPGWRMVDPTDAWVHF